MLLSNSHQQTLDIGQSLEECMELKREEIGQVKNHEEHDKKYHDLAPLSDRWIKLLDQIQPRATHSNISNKDHATDTCQSSAGHNAGFGHSEPGADLSSLHHHISTFSNDHCIVDPSHYDKNIYEKFIQDGYKKLLLVVDFDRTLTPLRISSRHSWPPVTHSNNEGHMSLSSHGIIELSEYVTLEYREHARQLFDYYYPIEFDMSIPDDVKLSYMVDWWSAAHELLVSCKLTRQIIHDSVHDALAKHKIMVRQGTMDMFALLAKYHIPIIVFSAGLYDVIYELFKQLNLLTPNVQIVSNHMMFQSSDTNSDSDAHLHDSVEENDRDMNARLIGFKGQLIHSLNKQYTAIACQLEHHEHSNTAHTSKERIRELWQVALKESEKRRTHSYHVDELKNVILIGDNIADVNMCMGMEHINGLCKIGFVNDKVSERMDQYKKAFDVLLLGDTSHQFTIQLLKDIVQGHSP